MSKRSRFVRPETTSLPISDGEILIVKKRLNQGEQRRHFARLYIAGIDGNLRVNPLQSGMAIVLAYLVDWTVTDEEGAIMPIRDLDIDGVEAVLDNLDPDDFQEIKDAIRAHEEAMQKERAAEKKLRAGESESPATSDSPSVAAGATNG